ncbi:MAG: translocation/assembly module TamB domain-containing protein, partial [Lacibacter sp.]|nr:translocation/assembly module TamB domain-containing protein [Lacibacter sp.]
LKANRLQTSYEDAASIYPPLRKITYPAISKISYLNFTGSYTGFFKDFVAYGTLQTNLGTLVTDINLKLPDNSEPIYSGKIKTKGFALGTFIKDPLFGNIVMDGSLKGRGFNPKTLFAEVDGNVQAFYLNGYTYRNITAKGIYEKQKFDGAFVVNDSNLIVNLTGIVNFSKDTPVYKVSGDVYNINFKELGITSTKLRLKSYVNLDFKGKNIDDFLGTANLQNAVLTNDTDQLSFDYLSLSSVIVDGKKQLAARSNEADVNIIGNFNILDLPNTALSFLNIYFPAYIPQPKKQVKNQDFTFDITTRNIAEYIDMLNIPVKGFNNSIIKGYISTNESTFNLQTDVPEFKYKDIGFNSTAITATGNYKKLDLKGSISEVIVNDSLSLPQTTFTVSAANDTGSVNIRTRASQTLKDANLNAKIKTNRDGVEIVFQPSTLVINDKVWNIEDKSDLFIGKKMIHSESIKLESGNESIKGYTKFSETGTTEDFVVELNNVHLEDIMPYVLKDPRLEGQVTGQVNITNPYGKIKIDADLKAERFRFNNDSIGVVTISGNYNVETGEINSNIVSDNPLYDFFSSGKINLKDPKNPTIDQVINAKNLKLSILEKYLSVIMRDMKGVANGIIRLQGNANAPDLIGNVKLSDASFLLDYTKCRYKMNEGAEIVFKEGEIDFGRLILTDTAKRTATFSGKMKHRFFKEMAFNMEFHANDTKRGFLVLNTTKKDNSLFYGNVIADASGTIRGDVDNIVMKFRGTPTDSSKIYLVTSDSRVTGTADFIVFRQYGKEMKVESKIKETSNLTVDLDVFPNPLAKIYLILDEVTNDIIEGQGDGNLNIRTSTNEGTSMSGRYNITNGRYTFNWEKLIEKDFIINDGYVEWNGNPYNARININARYTIDRIALPAELASGCSSNEQNSLTIISNLSGTLSNPEIKFLFELPQGHPCRNNPITISGFQRMYNNPNELNNQVFSLLVFNQFLSNTTNAVNAIGGIGTSIAGTLTEFLAQQIQSGLGLALKNIPGINKLKLDPYVTFTPGLISGAQAETQGFGGTGRFGVTKRFINGKLILKAGGSLLVNTGQNTSIQNNNQLTPDFTLEWLLSSDGKLRLIGFYRSVYDVQWRAANKTGLSLSYVRDFEF